MGGSNYQAVDTILVAIANLVNLLMVGIFLSRPPGLKKLERILGLVLIALSLPIAAVVVLNALGGREWWAAVLPAILVVFLLVELLLDYILKLDFRHTRLLGPYLLLYYVSLMVMVGYAFTVNEAYGAITLVTYFLQLFATWYSYKKVGHGER